ncbi:outer membrane protein assembly factor BamB family protein [Streptomyces phaeochromogenes]|uniref:outer membrane protein assembly factor BamB family protein n=1 Tax=Streptomyces phaeochromogenes TaxID=1923 RepID=UPI003718C4FE
MSQPPPPPPNQPPQGGGFGAPQDPPPGGFGAPTPPPATPPAGPPQQPQPGYGYPQAPGQAPQTPPPAGPPSAPPQQPYGYPQAPGAPQGAPQTPPAQPGYGYPGQQQPGYGYPGQQPQYGYQQPGTMPMQPQAPSGGRKVNPQVAIIVSAVVAIALIVGGGVWYANSSGKSDEKDTSAGPGGTEGKDDNNGGDDVGGGGGTEKVPANPRSKVLFQVPSPEAKEDTSIPVEGSWLTDKVYAKSGIAEVVGYDPDKGTKLWTISLPGPVCEGSRHTTEDNKTAILYKPSMPTKNAPQSCSEVAAIDLDSGKRLWTKSAKTGDQKIAFGNVTVGGGAVAAGSTSGGAAWSIDDGDLLWTPKASDTCYDAGYGGGEALVAVRRCGDYGDRQLQIQTLDPKTGNPLSQYKMARGIEYASVVSTNPLVVAADVGDSAGDGSGISDLFSIDAKTGELRVKISVPGDQYAAKCDGITRSEACSGLAVGNDRIYIPTEEHDGTGEYSQTNEIVSFSLMTGKSTGDRADAGDGYQITPLRMDGGNIIAYKRPPYDKGGQIVSIDGSSFKETKLLENPATEAVRDAETRMLPDYAEYLYGDGNLYMSQVFAREATSSGGGEYLVIAFGTS